MFISSTRSESSMTSRMRGLVKSRFSLKELDELYQLMLYM